MESIEFIGFAGTRLSGEVEGAPDDPTVLLAYGDGQPRAVWTNVASALVQAGRRVISLKLRGHEPDAWPVAAPYEFDTYVQDLRAVLAQMGTRPVVVAATLGGWVATAALGQDAANLAAGLVLVDLATMAGDDGARVALARLGVAAPKVSVPTLTVRGGFGTAAEGVGAPDFIRHLPDAEHAEVADADLRAVTDRTEAFNGLLLDFIERRLPRTAPEYRSGSDARTLRDALGCFATGITVVTATSPDGTPIGLTANSFTAVSLDPPLLLVCIASGATSAEVLKAAPHFAVNVLQIGQQPASNRFASKAEDRFGATPWVAGESGAPILTGSLGTFECAQHAVHDGGDHFILIGNVLRAEFEPRRDPLLYFRGKYRRLHFA